MNNQWKNAEGKLTGTAKAVIVSGAVVALVIAAISGAAGASAPSPSSASHDTASATPAPLAVAPETTETPTPTPEPAVEVGTTYDAAAPAGSSIHASSYSGEYDLTFGPTVFDATKLVMGENQFNDRPAKGEKYLVATVTLKNTGTESISPGAEALSITFIDPAGNAYQSVSAVLPKDITGTEAPPGTSVTGQLAFLVPADVTDGAFAIGETFVKAK